MTIIDQIRQEKLFEAQEQIEKVLNRKMLVAIHEIVRPTLKEVYGDAAMGLLEADEYATVDDEVCEGCDSDDAGDAKAIGEEEGDDDDDEEELEEQHLTEAKTVQDWHNYMGKLHMRLAKQQQGIRDAQQRIGELRAKKAKPEVIAKANEALTKKKESVKKTQEATKKAAENLQKWTQREAAKAQKARAAKSKPVAKKVK